MPKFALSLGFRPIRTQLLLDSTPPRRFQTRSQPQILGQDPRQLPPPSRNPKLLGYRRRGSRNSFSASSSWAPVGQRGWTPFSLPRTPLLRATSPRLCAKAALRGAAKGNRTARIRRPGIRAWHWPAAMPDVAVGKVHCNIGGAIEVTWK